MDVGGREDLNGFFKAPLAGGQRVPECARLLSVDRLIKLDQQPRPRTEVIVGDRLGDASARSQMP